MLTHSSVGSFIVRKSLLSPAVTGAPVLTSCLIFRWTARYHNIRVRWAHHQPWAALSGRRLVAAHASAEPDTAWAAGRISKEQIATRRRDVTCPY
jgi:hypothetical protein